MDESRLPTSSLINKFCKEPAMTKLITLTVKNTLITSANILHVSAGTTGHRGGDSGHGGRTMFAIRNDASTDMSGSLNGQPMKSIDSVELVFGGDTELTTLCQALRWILNELDPEMTAGIQHMPDSAVLVQ